MILNIYHTNDIHADFSFLSRVHGYLSAHREQQDFFFDSGDFLDLKSVIVRSGQGSGFRGTVLGCLGFSSNVTITRTPFSMKIDGKCVEPEKRYTLVTDDYLQRGTGYPSLAVPDDQARFDRRFIRDLVQEHLTDEAVFRTASISRERGNEHGI